MKTKRVIKETFITSLPLAAVIIIVCGFVSPMQNPFDYVKLAIGYAGVVFGQALFLVGLDISILPIGEIMGDSLIKVKKIVLIIFFGVIFGLFATVAEPALAVLARQTHMIMPDIHEPLFIWIMGAGIGIFVGFSFYRLVKDISIKLVFTVLYIAIFVLVFFVPEQFVALAFDGSGATTGDISVPFILALGFGVSVPLAKRKSNDNDFGIIGIASAGPVLTVFIYGIIFKAAHGGEVPPAGAYEPGAQENFGGIITGNMGAILMALLPVILTFIPFQLFLIKLHKKDFARIMVGAIPVYVGLLIFLSAIDFGFAFAGKYIGASFFDASRPEWFKWLLLIVGFVLGAAITLSEPAVTVLGEQLEKITNGHIKRMTIRFTLALGIGVAAVLAMIKIITEINILWFLIPLYIIALIMMRFTSNLFVGLAFDSGGVTGGALTSAFLTPLMLGVAQAVAAGAGEGGQSLMTNGFGIIAFISIMPMIAVQGLGIIYERRAKRIKVVEEETTDIVLLTIIARRRQREALLTALSEEAEVHLTNTMYGHGTTDMTILKNLLGLVPEKEKVVIITMTTAVKADAVMKMLVEEFHFDKEDTGVAFTMSVGDLSL